MAIPTLFHDIEWRHARAWIGRRVILKDRWLDFEAGTPCRVMSVIDFGDGLMFWITTDDAPQLEVDQFTRRELEVHFDVDGRPPALDRSHKRLRLGGSTMPDNRTRPALQALKSGS